MPIKVTLPQDTILEEIVNVANEYNSRKDVSMPRIELLHGTEGGFKIRVENLTAYYLQSYVEYTYKQMRWKKNVLISFYNYPGFSLEEETLLFQSMRQIYGKENVLYFPSYGHALANSPSTTATISQYIKISPKPMNLHNTRMSDNSIHSSNDSIHSHLQRVRIRL
jgi:hypothetical protein